MSAANKLIVALDVADVSAARALIARLDDAVNFYKIGLELLYRGGAELAHELAQDGKRVFFDAKLLDIGNTVERATANIAALGVDFLTLHGVDRKTMAAAIKGRGTSNLKLLAVTVMTNLDQADLNEQGITQSPQDMVLHRAKLAQEVGCDGVISSGHEAANIRAQNGADFLIVTPGIRPAGASTDDQARIMTPQRAITAGANHLVIGRPITQADNPYEAAKAIGAEIMAAS